MDGGFDAFFSCYIFSQTNAVLVIEAKIEFVVKYLSRGGGGRETKNNVHSKSKSSLFFDFSAHDPNVRRV